MLRRHQGGAPEAGRGWRGGRGHRPGAALSVSEANGRVSRTRAVPSPRGPRSASRWGGWTLGRGIKAPAFRPAPTSGCSSPRPRPFSSGAAVQEPVFSIQPIQHQLDFCHLSFIPLYNGCVSGGGWPPGGPRTTEAPTATVSPPRDGTADAASSASPSAASGKPHAISLSLRGLLFQVRRAGASSELLSISAAPTASPSPAAAAQVITEPRETRPTVLPPREAADMFPTVNIFPTEVLKGPVLCLWKETSADNSGYGCGK